MLCQRRKERKEREYKGGEREKKKVEEWVKVVDGGIDVRRTKRDDSRMIEWRGGKEGKERGYKEGKRERDGKKEASLGEGK